MFKSVRLLGRKRILSYNMNLKLKTYLEGGEFLICGISSIHMSGKTKEGLPINIIHCAEVLNDPDLSDSIVSKLHPDDAYALAIFRQHAKPTLEWISEGKPIRADVKEEFLDIAKTEIPGCLEALAQLTIVTDTALYESVKPLTHMQVKMN